MVVLGLKATLDTLCRENITVHDHIHILFWKCIPRLNMSIAADLGKRHYLHDCDHLFFGPIK